MIRRRLLRAGAAAAALAAAGSVRAQRPPLPLVVWFTVEGAKAMRQAALAFTAETGVEVVIVVAHICQDRPRGSARQGGALIPRRCG